MRPNARSIWRTLIIIIVLLGAGYVYLKFSQKQITEQRRQSEESMVLGRVEFAKGSDTEAVANLRKAITLANGDNRLEGTAKLRLGIYVTATEDPIEGVRILKEVVGNRNYDPAVRARAIDALEDHIQGTHDTSFARQYVFTGDPYASFLVDGDLELAARKLYEYSNVIYPNAKAELRIAEWYAGQLVDMVNPSQVVVGEYTGIIRAKIDSANDLFPTLSPQTGYLTAYLLMLRAGEEKILSEFNKGDFAKAEKDYKEALKITKSQPDDINLQDLELFVRFHYAAAIEDISGIKRASDIRELLKNFNSSNIKDRYFDKFIANEAVTNSYGVSLHKEHHHFEDIVDLAKISSEFKAKVESLGWVFK